MARVRSAVEQKCLRLCAADSFKPCKTPCVLRIVLVRLPPTVVAFEFFPCAQVPCTDIIENAKTSTSASAGVRVLAGISLGHSESGVHKVLDEQGCRLPVPLQFVDLPTQKKVPYVLMSDWAFFLASTGRLHYLVGTSDVMKRRELCLEFWRRLKQSRPDHPVYSSGQGDGQEDLDRLRNTIPLLHHGDEGRTYRKLPLMVLSTHGVLGRGYSQAADKNKNNYAAQEDPMRLNFLGSTISTHYIFAALPHSLYKKCPEALDTMLELYAKDMEYLATNGLLVPDGDSVRRIYFQVLAVKGDLPYLGKAAHFSRTYSMCPKQSESKKAASGICYRCWAGVEGGQENWPWEEFVLQARWLRTDGMEPAGFSRAGPLLHIPHDKAMWLYRLDIWHTFHLGCGKSFAASAIVVLLESMEEQGTIDQRLSLLTEDYRSFCKRTRSYAFITQITRDLLAWQNSNDMPAGSWHKGFLTTRLFEWLEDYMGRLHKDDTHPALSEVVPRFPTF